MARTLAITIILFGLAGCANLPKWPFFTTSSETEPRGEPGHYNFEWRLSGDRAVAPVQIFDNGRRTWLQFAPGQSLPAIFERTRGGDRPLDFRREGPYVVLSGLWPNLVLRGGHLKSFADRTADQPIEEAPLPSLSTGALGLGSPLEPMPVQSDRISIEPSIPAAPVAVAQLVDPPASLDINPALIAAPPDDQRTTDNLGTDYAVEPADKNLRMALSRWARMAGWVFEAEHWAVDADIPIVGSARFESEFKGAVRELVASTELADRPLQPCFYSNKVLRVVPYAQSCDRTAGAPGAS